MQNHVLEAIKKLNRISFLYDYSIQNCKPYRIGKVRDMYQMVFKEIDLAYSIHEFDCKNYRDVFDSDKKMELVSLKKEESISRQEYEEAAFYRDKEKTVLRSLLFSIGVNETDKFFVWNETIYKISW